MKYSTGTNLSATSYWWRMEWRKECTPQDICLISKGKKQPNKNIKTHTPKRQTNNPETTKPQLFQKEHSFSEQLTPYSVSALSSFMTKPSQAQKALFRNKRNMCFEQRTITTLPYMANSYYYMLRVKAADILPSSLLKQFKNCFSHLLCLSTAGVC